MCVFSINRRDDSHYTEVEGATVKDLVGYITTWSGFRQYAKDKGSQAAETLLNDFKTRFEHSAFFVLFYLQRQCGSTIVVAGTKLNYLLCCGIFTCSASAGLCLLIVVLHLLLLLLFLGVTKFKK